MGEKRVDAGSVTWIVHQQTTVFSDILIEPSIKDSTSEIEHSDSMSIITDVPNSPDYPAYKYAPKYGSTSGYEEVLVYFTKKLKPRQYGGEN